MRTKNESERKYGKGEQLKENRKTGDSRKKYFTFKNNLLDLHIIMLVL